MGRFPIQQKFLSEILEIPHVQWNGTFRLQRLRQQFCGMERDVLVQLPKMTRPVKVDHLKRRSQIFQSD